MESRALRISIVVAGIILVIIILIIAIFSKRSTISGKKTITPTPVENNYQKDSSKTDSKTLDTTYNNYQKDGSKTSDGTYNYYEDSDFTVRYDPTTSDYIINQKNSQAGKKITEWLAQHPELGQNVTIEENNGAKQATSGSEADNPENIVRNTIVGLLKMIFLPRPISTSSSFINSSNYPSLPNQPSTTTNGLVYYPQCNGSYDDYPIPYNCNVCKAGCGPVTVAMIVASYVNPQVKPPTIVDDYQKKAQSLSCSGSTATSAKMILESYGIKTSDYLFSYGLYPINEVADDFKNYLKSGWTIFANANFKPDGGGHFFWIVDIDANNNIWAYDPYYGRFQAPPLNENKYSPFPKYKIAFAIKRK